MSEVERDPRCDCAGLKDGRRTHKSGNTGSFWKLERQGNRHHWIVGKEYFPPSTVLVGLLISKPYKRTKQNIFFC